MNTVIGQAGIDIGAIIKKIRSKWYLFLVSAVLAFFIGLLLAMYLPPKFKVTSSVRVNDVATSKVVEDLFDGVQLVKDQKVIADEIAILKSYSLVSQTLRDLNFKVSYFQETLLRPREFYQDAPFIVKLDSTMPQMVNIPVEVRFLDAQNYTIEVNGENVEIYDFQNNRLLREKIDKVEISETLKVGDYFEHPYLKFQLTPDAYFNEEVKEGRYFFKVNDLDRLTERYRKKLGIATITKDASILELKIEGKLKNKEIDFLNRLVELYVKKNYEKKNSLAISTIEFIDRQLMGISDSLKRAEKDLERSRSNINVMDLSYESKNAYDQLQELEKQKSTELIKSKYYNYLLRYVKSNSGSGDIVAPSVMGIQDATLNNLINKLSELEAKKVTLSYSARGENPRVKMLKQNIRNTKKAILENVNSINVSSKITLDNINDRVSSVEQTIDGLPQTERLLLSAQRRFEFNDNIYNYLLQKRVEAAILKASNAPTDIIVDRAQVEGNKPVSPKKPLLLGASMFAGLLFPLMFIFFKDILSNKLLYQGDIAKLTQVPIAAVIQRNRGSRQAKGMHMVALGKSGLESFRALRMKIHHMTTNKTIGISSLVGGDGKSFVALHLARTFAMAGKRTLLIDANIDAPSLHEYFHMRNAPGLKDILAGKPELKEVVKKTDNGKLFLLPAGDIHTNGTDLFDSDRFAKLFAALEKSFDHIVVDSAALNRTSDYFALYPLLDLNLFVVRKNHSPIDFTPLNEMVKDADENKFHAIFNDA